MVTLAKGTTFKYDYLLAGEVTLTGGTATWEETARPEQRALTVYAGTELAKLDVPILLDGWPDEGVEHEVRQIIDLSRGDGIDRPASFRAFGPMPLNGGTFVMELPEWGEGIRSRHGDLVRQHLTLKLIEWINPDRLRSHKIGHKKAKPGHILVKDHETLLQISARVFGDTDHARDIGKLNGVRDIRKPLKPGTELTIPHEHHGRRHNKGSGSA